MNILVTGSDGFIAKNLIFHLKENGFNDIHRFNSKSDPLLLKEILKKTDFIFHLAGVNRPINDEDYLKINSKFTEYLCNMISDQDKKIPLVFTSSTQVDGNSAYGKSKLRAEEYLKKFEKSNNNPVYIFRLPNVFGKWCKPNYNSVVATFCHNIINDLPINIDNPDKQLTLVHVDDVVQSFIKLLDSRTNRPIYQEVESSHKVTLGHLAKTLLNFKKSRENNFVEDVGYGFERLLYSTFLSYLNPSQFSYPLHKNSDARGIFVEMLKTRRSGQVSFFSALPAVTRGQHYHHIKNEKFLVIQGDAKFSFKHIDKAETHEICVSGLNPEIVESIPGWSHAITNIGNSELLCILWSNEVFDKDKPDTLHYDI